MYSSTYEDRRMRHITQLKLKLFEIEIKKVKYRVVSIKDVGFVGLSSVLECQVKTTTPTSTQTIIPTTPKTTENTNTKYNLSLFVLGNKCSLTYEDEPVIEQEDLWNMLKDIE